MLKQVCCEGVSKGMSMRMLKDSTPRSAFSRISNVLLSSQKALEKLGLQPDEVISIGNSLNVLKQAQLTGVMFVGACWDSKDREALKRQTDTIDHPMELIKFFQ